MEALREPVVWVEGNVGELRLLRRASSPGDVKFVTAAQENSRRRAQ
jgi:hypothetical protein